MGDFNYSDLEMVPIISMDILWFKTVSHKTILNFKKEAWNIWLTVFPGGRKKIVETSWQSLPHPLYSTILFQHEKNDVGRH